MPESYFRARVQLLQVSQFRWNSHSSQLSPWAAFSKTMKTSQGVLQYLNVTLEINPPVCLFAGQEIMTNLGHISPQIERQNTLSNVRLVSAFTDMVLYFGG